MSKAVQTLKLDTVIFLLLVLVVLLLQYSLLNSQLNYGFMPDDWWPLYEYKMLVSPNSIASLKEVWEGHGIYTLYQIYYIGTLENFFGFDFFKFQLTNQVFKALSVLSIYPLVLIIFKRRLLAVLATILYGISYPPVGTLEITAKGTDYLAISVMSLFVVTYYQIVKGGLKGIRWVMVTLALLLSGLLLSPIRMYPILALIFLLEVYLFLKNSDKKWRAGAIKRMAILYSPFILAFLITPGSFTRFIFIHPGPIIHFISVGNWQMLLSPFASLGSTFVNNWSMFGSYKLDNFSDYLIYISGGPMVIFGVLTLLLSIIFFKKPFTNFGLIFLTNLILELAAFFVMTHQFSVESGLRIGYDPANIYSILGGVYSGVLSFYFYREWRKTGEQNNILMALWSSIVFSSVFIWLTWALSDHTVVVKTIHSYLNVPAIGTSIFLAAIITGVFDKLTKIARFNLGKLIAPSVFLLLIPIYIQSQTTIQNYLHSFLDNGMDAREQQEIRNKLWNQLGGYDNNISNLFFLDTREDLPNGRFYEISIVANFGKWSFFWSGQNKDRCKLPQFIVYDKEILIKSVRITNGRKKIIYPDSCGVETGYTSSNFYAFKLLNREPIDIKKQLLKELGVD